MKVKNEGYLVAIPASLDFMPDPLYSVVIASPHITLLYDVNRGDYSDLIGKTFTAIAISEYYDGLIQAVKMAVPVKIPGRDHLHITMSHKSGVMPVSASRMIATASRNNINIIGKPVKLTIDFVYFKKGFPDD